MLCVSADDNHGQIRGFSKVWTNIVSIVLALIIMRYLCQVWHGSRTIKLGRFLYVFAMWFSQSMSLDGAVWITIVNEYDIKTSTKRDDSTVHNININTLLTNTANTFLNWKTDSPLFHLCFIVQFNGNKRTLRRKLRGHSKRNTNFINDGRVQPHTGWNRVRRTEIM